jgi:hypothetical protein
VAATVAMVALPACFSVPEPPPPSSAERVVGADLSGTAVGHWSCPAGDVLLAKRDSRFVLHELNLDAIASQAKPIVDGRLEFTIGMGPSTFVYAVPQDVTKPAWLFLNIVQSNGMDLVYDHPARSMTHPNEIVFSQKIENKTEQKDAVLCPPAPLPRFL